MDIEFDDLREHGLQSWIILLQDSNFRTPDSAYCAEFKKQHNLKMRVLYDANAVTGIYGIKETSVVTNEQGVIVAKFQSDAPTTIKAALVDELSIGPGQCKSDPICGTDGICLPTPTGSGNVCSSQCEPANKGSCPDGKVCFTYGESHGDVLNGTSACFKPELLPEEK